jgi:FMN reductase
VAPAKGQRAEVVKAKTVQANQNLGINRQIEQEEVLPSAAVPDLQAAESRLQHKAGKTSIQADVA